MNADDKPENAPVLQALWAVLAAWPAAKKRLFVKFVTGVDQLPASGIEVNAAIAAAR